MKKIFGTYINHQSIESHNKQPNHFNSLSKMSRIQKAYLDNTSNLKGSRSFRSLHHYKHSFNIHKNQNDNSKILQLQNTSLIVFLMYKKKRISLKFDYLTPFKKINQKFFQQLAYFQMETYKLNRTQRKIELSKIKGFKTLDGDINFDYRFSLEQGILQSNVFLSIFQKPQNNSKLLFQSKRSLKTQNNHYQTFKNDKKQDFQYYQIKDSYQIYTCLAIGGFSKVYLARSYKNGKFYAIKFVRKQNLEKNAPKQKIDQQIQKLQSILNQIQLCKGMNHTFIIKLHHAFQTKNFYALAFQYCPGGQLFFLLKKVKVMNQQKARFYFIQILYAIQYLHKKNIIYRDLKPQNILIDYKGNLKIVDFGLSKTIAHIKERTHSYCGSAQYMAPQMILRTGHSFPIDYYSLGTLLYELVTGLPPFYTRDQVVLQESICCAQLTFPRQANLSDDIKDFLSKLLAKQEKYRLGSLAGIKQILFHPWIGKTKTISVLNKQIPAPYPPNLKQHNFDRNQLGQDQSQFTHDVIQDISVPKYSNQKKIKQHGILKDFYHQSQNQNSIDEKQNNKNKSFQIKYQTQPFQKYIQNAENSINQRKVQQDNKKTIQTLTFYVSPQKLKDIQQQYKKSLHQQQQKTKSMENKQEVYALGANKKILFKNAILKINSPHKKQKVKQIKYNPIILQENKRKSKKNQSLQQLSPNVNININFNVHHQTFHFPQTSLSHQKFQKKYYKNKNIRIKDKISKNSIHFKSLPKPQILKQYSNQNQILNKSITNNSNHCIPIPKTNQLSKQLQYIKKLPKPYIKSSLDYIKASMKAQKLYNVQYTSNKTLKKTAHGTFIQQNQINQKNLKQNISPNIDLSTPLSKLRNQNNSSGKVLKVKRKVFGNITFDKKGVLKQQIIQKSNKQLMSCLTQNRHSYAI